MFKGYIEIKYYPIFADGERGHINQCYVPPTAGLSAEQVAVEWQARMKAEGTPVELIAARVNE